MYPSRPQEIHNHYSSLRIAWPKYERDTGLAVPKSYELPTIKKAWQNRSLKGLIHIERLPFNGDTNCCSLLRIAWLKYERDTGLAIPNINCTSSLRIKAYKYWEEFSIIFFGEFASTRIKTL